MYMQVPFIHDSILACFVSVVFLLTAPNVIDRSFLSALHHCMVCVDCCLKPCFFIASLYGVCGLLPETFSLNPGKRTKKATESKKECKGKGKGKESSARKKPAEDEDDFPSDFDPVIAQIMRPLESEYSS